MGLICSAGFRCEFHIKELTCHFFFSASWISNTCQKKICSVVHYLTCAADFVFNWIGCKMTSDFDVALDADSMQNPRPIPHLKLFYDHILKLKIVRVRSAKWRGACFLIHFAHLCLSVYHKLKSTAAMSLVQGCSKDMFSMQIFH